MPAIPKNNLKERLTKLGYDPNGIQIIKPVLDNSRVVPDSKPTTSYQNKPYKSNMEVKPAGKTDFKPLDILKPLDDWSDFEDE